jgi:hypothetical protein
MSLILELNKNISKDERRDIYLQMGEIALKNRLAVSEETFVRSLVDWMGNGHYLTPKQMNKLEQIYLTSTRQE